VDHTIRQMKKLGTNFGIGAFAVIDGRALPAKEEENAQRQKKRNEAFSAAKAAEAKEEFDLATKLYFKACGIAERCAENDISFVKAPHEADAQMVRAVEDGLASFIITEDSDMLALGSPHTIFKINFKDGTGQEVTQERLLNNNLSGFKDFTIPMLVLHNILQGNDYSVGVRGFGIVGAQGFVSNYKTIDSVLAALKRKFKVEDDAPLLLPNKFSEDMLLQAYWTMRGHPVYKKTEDGYELSNLHPLPPDIAARFPFLRLDMSPRVATGLASGFLDEETKQPSEDVLSFDDEEEVDDAPPSAKQERIRRDAAELERMKKWLNDEVEKLRADPEKYAETRALFKRMKEANEARVTALDKDDPYRITYDQYQYAAECRMLELKSKLPDSISEDQIDEMIALAEDQCMVIALEHIIHEDGTFRNDAAIVNACKYMPDPNSGLPKCNEMTASLWKKGHSPYLVKDTGSGTGKHFSQKEVHVVGTGEPTEDTMLQVRQIVCYEGDGDVVAFLLEQVQGEFFRKHLPGGGGTGYAMNRCVSGVVRDPHGLAKHASGILVILDPLSKLRDGSVGISNQQSPNNMIDIKQNLPKCIKLLRCTTTRATFYGGQGTTTPIPYVISTSLPPTDDSVVHIAKTAVEMKALVGGGGLTKTEIGEGKLVIPQGGGLPDIYAIPFRPSLELTHKPGQTPKPDMKRLLEQRDTSKNCPILLNTNKDPNVGIIAIVEGIELVKELVRTGIIRTTLSQDKLRVSPMLVLNWDDKGIEIWAHLFDPEISSGKPGDVFNKLIYNALVARDVSRGGKSKGAISVFRNEQDANSHLPIITGPGWNKCRGAIGANNSGVTSTEALAGKAFDCSIIGSAYTREHEKEDGHLGDKELTLFYQQAMQHCPNLVDRLKDYPNTLCVGKSESQCEPELLHEPEQPSVASITPPPPGRETRSRKRSSGSYGENDQPNSPQKSSRSRRRT